MKYAEAGHFFAYYAEQSKGHAIAPPACQLSEVMVLGREAMALIDKGLMRLQPEGAALSRAGAIGRLRKCWRKSRDNWISTVLAIRRSGEKDQRQSAGFLPASLQRAAASPQPVVPRLADRHSRETRRGGGAVRHDPLKPAQGLVTAQLPPPAPRSFAARSRDIPGLKTLAAQRQCDAVGGRHGVDHRLDDRADHRDRKPCREQITEAQSENVGHKPDPA